MLRFCIKMLSNLPLEVLDNLFGCLEEKDKLRLAQVNGRLGCAFAFHSRMEYKELCCSNYTEDELKIIITFCGYTINEVDIKSNAAAIIGELIAKYCINLETGSFQIEATNFDAIKCVLKMRGLQTIRLLQLPLVPSGPLQYVNSYCKSLNLYTFMGEEQHLRQLIHLQELQVNLFPVEAKNIFEICSHLKKLRILIITDYSFESSHKKDYSFGELEELELFGFTIQSDLPTCPKLKKLRLISIQCRIGCIGDIIAKYANTLEHLVFTPLDGLYRFYAENLIIVLRKCKRLLFINTTVNIINVLFTKYLETFIEVVKENGFNTQNRFILEMNVLPSVFIGTKRELMQKYPNSEAWSLITLNNTKEKDQSKKRNMK